VKKFERKDLRVIFRISKKDYNRAIKNAEFVEMKFSDYIREAVLNYMPKKMGGIAPTLKKKKDIMLNNSINLV